METNFKQELESLINSYSLENQSDTPDFILAKYLQTCLDNFSAAILQREEWYGRQKHITDLPVDYDDTGSPPLQPPVITTAPPEISPPEITTDNTGNDNYRK